jgi:deazaflavin-dependent oxidoreductase (nitroreductase family)
MAKMPRPRFTSLPARAGGRLLRSRCLVRAPIWIYKARAGALFGSRILMLEHFGRKSGARRYAVLEVVDHPVPDSYVVASGFGRKAQWFRNIQANRRVRVWAGSRRPVPATARVLDQTEADRALAAYRSRHPRAWERFKPVLEGTLGMTITDTDTPLPMVELRLA